MAESISNRLQILRPVSFEIFKHQIAQSLQAAVVSVAVVGFGEFSHKCFQIRISRNHKRSDRNFYFSQLHSEVKCLVQNFLIETETIFIIFDSLLDTGWLAIGDHKDLFVGILLPAQNSHRQL